MTRVPGSTTAWAHCSVNGTICQVFFPFGIVNVKFFLMHLRLFSLILKVYTMRKTRQAVSLHSEIRLLQMLS